MRKFNVIVNGEAFTVEIEEVGGSASQSTATESPAPVKPAAAPKVTAAPVAPPKPEAPKAAATGAAGEMPSPLPGTVLDILAQEGQSVAAGEVVMILEAMKMENEIVAPGAGTISAIHVKKGENVQAGDLLFTLG